MRGVVRCDHCGAPHRREAASTRFRCDWCGGDNRVEVVRLVEELILAADDRTRDPATRVREALGSRGLRGATLNPQAPRWAGLWQVVNEDGEEFLAPPGFHLNRRHHNDHKLSSTLSASGFVVGYSPLGWPLAQRLAVSILSGAAPTDNGSEKQRGTDCSVMVGWVTVGRPAPT